MMIFETERLRVRKLIIDDHEQFYVLMSNPKVMLPIPRKPLSRIACKDRLLEFIDLEKKGATRIWCLTTKKQDDLIGICGFLKNNANDDEIAYSICENSWGKGYGTEIAKGLIDYAFTILKVDKITADVNILNTTSEKILQKFMRPTHDFFNPKDNCVDRRYILEKENWLINHQ